MKLAEALLQALADRGATEVFGIPGDFALPFFDVLDGTDILPYYTFSHEPAVGFAADAAARYRGGLGVAAVTYGAGALNLVNAIAGAYAEKSPVVVISGAPGTHERNDALLLHHQAKTLGSQHRIFQEVTCDEAILDQPKQAPQAIARVLDACLRQSRPVYLELPRDLAMADVDPVPETPAPAVDRDAVQACAAEVWNRLDAAASPVMLVGVEVRRHGLEAKAAQLARLANVPVATSFLGRGLLTGCDCPFLGTYLGMAGSPEVRTRVEEADALLMLGVILCDTNLGVSARRIDGRAAMDASDGRVRLGHHYYPGIPLAALLDALIERATPLRRDRAEAAVAPRTKPADDGAGISPEDVSAAIDDAMARHGRLPMASDMGDGLFMAMDVDDTELVAPGYYAGMGFAVPAGLGLQAATGRRPLILAGDGAFQMTGWELGHCCRYGWDPIVVVLNNRGWGTLAAFRPEARYTDLGDWPMAKLGTTLGGEGVRVGTRHELVSALEQAFHSRGRFQLIEVMLQRGQTTDTLRRFATAMSRHATHG